MITLEKVLTTTVKHRKGKKRVNRTDLQRIIIIKKKLFSQNPKVLKKIKIFKLKENKDDIKHNKNTN